ncbi:hypothetical protein ABGB14_47450 [Nonomuraea sp. B10E15]
MRMLKAMVARLFMAAVLAAPMVMVFGGVFEGAIPPGVSWT